MISLVKRVLYRQIKDLWTLEILNISSLLLWLQGPISLILRFPILVAREIPCVKGWAIIVSGPVPYWEISGSVILTLPRATSDVREKQMFGGGRSQLDYFPTLSECQLIRYALRSEAICEFAPNCNTSDSVHTAPQNRPLSQLRTDQSKLVL